MAHIHFAWELGGGLGHAGRLLPLAQEALRRGHRVSLSLRDVTQTQALLGGLQAPIFQAPIWLHQVRGIPEPAISLAEILQGCGYLNADTLRGLFRAWTSLLGTLKPDVVVGDYAPTALLACRTLGIPHASIGIGFWLPPAGQALPNLRDWEAAQPGRLQSAEARLLQAANTVLGEVQAPALAQAWELFHGQHMFAQTWPEFDHFQRGKLPDGQRWWGPAVSAHSGQDPVWPPAAGPRVFAYLKAQHPDHALVLKALLALGCVVECYMPEVASGKPPPVVHASLHYAKGPVHLSRALETAVLCINHAGEATVAAALLAGVPVFLMPTQTEQFLAARSIEVAGLGLNASARQRPLDYAQLLKPLLANGTARQAAQAFAQRHQGFTPQQQARDLVDAIAQRLQP